MSHHATSIAASPTWATLRERCSAIGLSTWLSDTSGELVSDPNEPGVLTLWLQSQPVRSIVATAARVWSDQARPATIRPIDGLWLMPIVHELRGRRTGLTVAAAMGPAVIGSPLFEAASRSAGLDPTSVRATATRAAQFDQTAVDRLSVALDWMSRDLASLYEHETAVNGFTAELSQSYETIDMLYTLGRTMKNLSEPESFFDGLFERLYETLPFNWLCVVFEQDPKSLGELSGHTGSRGDAPWSLDQLTAVAATLRSALPETLRTTIISEMPAAASGPTQAPTPTLVQPVIVSGKLLGVLFCGDRKGLDPQISSYDMQLIEAAAAFTAAFLENARLYRDQQAMFMGSLRALTAAIDAKDRYTCGHSERVAYLGRMLASASGMTEVEAQRVHLSGMLHDVGKIGVPEAVLCKPSRLTDEEFNQIKRHPAIGYDILKGIPMLEDILPGVLHHHERYDGKGYPHGLSGEQIPLMARILAIADTFDAMSSTRAYRAGLPRDKALAEFERCAGTQFDPVLAKLFVTLDFTEYDAMVSEHAKVYQPIAIASGDIAKAA